MAALTALVLLAAGMDVGTVLSAVSSLGIVGAVIAVLTARSTVRKASSEADEADLKVDEIRARLTRGVMEDVEKQLAEYRERIHEERTRAAVAAQGQADAQAKLAEAQLLLAETLEQASKERHTLTGQLGEIKLENALLKRQIADLKDEIESLRAQLDTNQHGRRQNDPPQT